MRQQLLSQAICDAVELRDRPYSESQAWIGYDPACLLCPSSGKPPRLFASSSPWNYLFPLLPSLSSALLSPTYTAPNSGKREVTMDGTAIPTSLSMQPPTTGRSQRLCLGANCKCMVFLGAMKDTHIRQYNKLQCGYRNLIRVHPFVQNHHDSMRRVPPLTFYVCPQRTCRCLGSLYPQSSRAGHE